MSEDLKKAAAPTLPELEEAAHLAGKFHIRLHGFGQYDDAFDAEICARLARLIAHVRTPAPATTAGQQGEARPAPAEVERLARAYIAEDDASVTNVGKLMRIGRELSDAALATQAAPEESGERDTLRALLRLLRTAMLLSRAHVRWLAFGECRSPGWDDAPPTAAQADAALCDSLARIDAALADGGAK